MSANEKPDVAADVLPITFDIPGPDAPGFLLRERTRNRLQGIWSAADQGKLTVPDGFWDELVEFFADFVTHVDGAVVDDVEQARAALWHMSQDDWQTTLDAFAPVDDDSDAVDAAVPKASATS